MPSPRLSYLFNLPHWIAQLESCTASLESYILIPWLISDIRCGQVDCWKCAEINGKDIFDNDGYMAHGHAAESGTSVLMYLRPDLVRKSEITTVRPDPAFYKSYPDIIRYTKLSEKTENGMVGDAESASADKGKAIVERCVERVVQFMRSEFGI